MKISVEEIENGYLIKELSNSDAIEACYAYVYDEYKTNDEVQTQVRVLQHIGWGIRKYNKYSEQNLKVVIEAGHKLKDDGE